MSFFCMCASRGEVGYVSSNWTWQEGTSHRLCSWKTTESEKWESNCTMKVLGERCTSYLKYHSKVRQILNDSYLSHSLIWAIYTWQKKGGPQKIDFILTLVGYLENTNSKIIYMMSPPKDTSCCRPSLAVSKISQKIIPRISELQITLRERRKKHWHHLLC